MSKRTDLFSDVFRKQKNLRDAKELSSMIQYAPLEALIVMILVSPIVLFALKRKYRGTRLFSAFALAAYLILISKYFFFPIILDKEIVFQEGFIVQLIPFVPFSEQIQSVGWKQFLYQAAGNILAFVPISFLLSILYPRLQRFRNNLLTMFGISFCIEFIQLCINVLTGIPNRAVDINDIILNTLGGVMGHLLYQLWHRLVGRDGSR